MTFSVLNSAVILACCFLLSFQAVGWQTQAPPEGTPFEINGGFGTLNFRPIVLEPPANQIDTIVSKLKPEQPINWSIQKSFPQTRKLLLDCGIPPEVVKNITSSSRVSAHNESVRLFPTDEEILNLSPESRRDLYPFLNGTTNLLWRGGFREMAGSESTLSQKTLDEISKLSYLDNRGRPMFFDLRLATARANSAERCEIVKTLLRCRSQQVSLSWVNMSPAERTKMVEYWDSSGQNKEGSSILKSFIETSSIEQISFVRILPPRCRELLNTYPHELKSRGVDWPDCFTTAFSFFDNNFSYRSFDSISNLVKELYEKATMPPQFGDVITVIDKNGEWVHACNYLAAGFTFTKNGEHESSPWVISHLSHVIDLYQTHDADTLLFLRKRQ